METLPSGDVIPLLSFEREDRSWSDWGSRDGGFAVDSCFQEFAALERFNFLGQWMARAYVISESLAPASLHSTIYESLVAGHTVTPLPMPNAYQDRLLGGTPLQNSFEALLSPWKFYFFVACIWCVLALRL